MKKTAMMRIAALTVAMMLGGMAHAITSGPYTPIEASTGDVVPGEWNASIEKGKAYAEAHNMPMLAVGGSVTCGGCHLLQTACNTDEFKAWAAKKQIVMVFGTDSATRDFCKKGLTTLPVVCIYWPYADGTVLEEHFTGLVNQMPSKEGATLEAQFISTCDLYIGDYPQVTGREYMAFTDDYENARLEAEVGFTKYVDVPLSRDSVLVGHVGTNRFTAVLGDAVLVDEDVVWEPSAKEASVRVAIPDAAVAGDVIVANLSRLDGEDCGTTRINVVAPRGNSTKNPLFLGERTASDLQYGEWTMDLDVAMEKYRAEPESRLMVVASGSLWCPDCVMTDEHVLETDAFRKWAEDGKVILVDLDVPNFGPREGASACLLTRNVVRVSDGYVSGRGTLATNELERYQSGAGYLSRHMVSDADAAKVLERNRSLVGRNTLAGGWNSPSRANQDRTGIPNFFALRRDGTLAGTFETFDAIGPSGFDDAYLARFSELVEMGASSEDDIDNRTWQTTKDVFAGTGESATATLAPLDLVDTCALAATPHPADVQTVMVKGTGDASVEVSLIAVINGAQKVLAVSEGSLASGVSVEGVISSSGDYYVQVKGAASGALSVLAPAGSKVEYTISGVRREVENPFTNAWTSKAATTTLPLFAADGRTLKGLLELKLKKTGKFTARWTNGSKLVASFSGKWDADIEADGTATASASKGGSSLSLTMTSEGVISASVSGGAELSSGPCALQENYGEFAGSYVAAAPSGNVIMTLTVTSAGSGRKNGTLKYKVFLPGGQTLSGRTNLTGIDADFALAPILKKKGTTTFAAALKVRRSASKAPTRRAVIALDASDGIYGSWYSASDSLVASAGADSLVFRADAASLVPASDYGALTSAAGDGARVAVSPSALASADGRFPKGFSLRLNRKTGIFKGRMALSFERKAKASASIVGVVMPGWYSDCECSEDGDKVVPLEYLDFGIGFATFPDSVGGSRTKRGMGVRLGAQ